MLTETWKLALQLGYRNLWRRKRRTLLTIASVTVSTGLVVFFFAFQLSAWEVTIDSSTGLFQGQLQIQNAAYWDQKRFEYTVDEPSQLISQLRKDSRIRAVTPRAQGFALVSSGERTYGVQVIGVDATTEGTVSRVPSLVREGSYFGTAPGIVLGKSLSQNLQVKLGDEITVLGQGKDGSLAAFLLPVQGIFESGSPEFDRAFIQIPLEYMQENFALDNSVHLLAAKLGQNVDIEQLQKDLQRKVSPDLVVLRWDQFISGLKEAITLDLIAGWLFFLSLIIIATFIIANTIAMSVLERTHEFGVMLALGTAQKLLFLTVIAETLFICLFGVVAGIVLGSSAILYFQYTGFTIPGAKELAAVWNMPTVLYPYLTALGLTAGPTVLLILGTLVAIPSALRASALRVVEALKAR